MSIVARQSSLRYVCGHPPGIMLGEYEHNPIKEPRVVRDFLIFSFAFIILTV